MNDEWYDFLFFIYIVGLQLQIYFGHQHPCENHCENKGICTLKALDSVPHCHCIDGWHGSTCEIPDDCENYCLNGATCQYPRDNDYMPICLWVQY